MAGSPLIRFDHVSKIYGKGETEVRALDAVSLSIDDGEFVAIMGPSGSGKSTAMNILGCLDTPTSGRYFFRGVDAGTLNRSQRALLRRNYIGFVFQGFNLLKRTTARENLELPLIYRGEPASVRKAQALKALSLVGLADRADHTSSELSGGQQQRVAIARALVTEPAVIFADEPTGNLDTARTHEIMKLLDDLNRTRHITIVLVTHEEDVAAYAGRQIRFPRRAHRVRRADAKGRCVMWWTTLQLAWRELRANVLRSLLTTLGIIVGVAAVVIVVTLGQGLTMKVTADIASMGRNLLFVLPFTPQRAGPATPQTPFKMDDSDAIEREIQGLAAVAPSTIKQTQAVYGSNNWQVAVNGTTNPYLIVRDWPIAQGRAFTDSEERGGRTVCILGETPRKELFGQQTPLGAKIRLGATSCEVVGVLAPKGQSTFGQDQDDTILMPILAVQRRMTGATDVQQIWVSAATAAGVHPVQEAIATLMRERRRIRPGEQDDFLIRDLQSVSSLVESTTALLTAGLSAVAAISLLVGGIGIMNIMLVSVTERTREIGIRLAIGALERDVLLQFLIEAVLLSCVGGLIGAALGLTASAAIAYAIGVPFVLSPWVVVVSFGFSAAVGIVFGFFPARRAASLDPIEALRYE